MAKAQWLGSSTTNTYLHIIRETKSLSLGQRWKDALDAVRTAVRHRPGAPLHEHMSQQQKLMSGNKAR